MEVRVEWRKRLTPKPEEPHKGSYALSFKEIEDLYVFAYNYRQINQNEYILETNNTGVGTKYTISTVIDNQIVEKDISDYENW